MSFHPLVGDKRHSVKYDESEVKLMTGLSSYLDRRMWRILLLGAISGFPWVLIGSALTLWLEENGFSRSAIGWAGLIYGVYAINFLWAPLIDNIRIPFLSTHFGHRKSWIMCFQAFILLLSKPVVWVNNKLKNFHNKLTKALYWN